MQAKQNWTLIDSKWFLFFIIPLDFFFLIKYIDLLFAWLLKFLDSLPIQIVDMEELNTLEYYVMEVFIGNDNVEDDESPSSSPKCQKKIDLFF